MTWLAYSGTFDSGNTSGRGSGREPTNFMTTASPDDASLASSHTYSLLLARFMGDLYIVKVGIEVNSSHLHDRLHR